MSLREAIAICLLREHLRKTLLIALVVGTILMLINQADMILAGDATDGTWIKVGLSYCVPFVVSNLGLLTGKRTEAVDTPTTDGDHVEGSAAGRSRARSASRMRG